jgi:hypothetical protein
MDLDTLLNRLAELVAEKLAARLNGNGKGTEESDTLLTAGAVAARLGVTVRWVYAHAARLPFVVRLPGRGVRFSARGLARWLEKKTRGV